MLGALKTLRTWTCGARCRCRANMARVRQPRPDSGLSFQLKVLSPFEWLPFAGLVARASPGSSPSASFATPIFGLRISQPLRFWGPCDQICPINGPIVIFWDTVSFTERPVVHRVASPPLLSSVLGTIKAIQTILSPWLSGKSR